MSDDELLAAFSMALANLFYYEFYELKDFTYENAWTVAKHEVLSWREGVDDYE